MSRAQQAALSLLDRMEELAIIPTFVQVCSAWSCSHAAAYILHVDRTSQGVVEVAEAGALPERRTA